MERHILFKEKKDCCGCGACFNICPKQAITMTEDEYGFVYPEINENLCINCGLCNKVCFYQNREESQEVLKTFAAADTNKERLAISASGGIFASVAANVLKASGSVYGCAYEQTDEALLPKHIRITDEKDLIRIQGSKYVQSDTGIVYTQVKEDLKTGIPVLFTGTPCQVAGLYGFLIGQDYPNLYTIDIICHGVPNARMFNDYLKVLDKRLGGRVTDFRFRDKANGWGLTAKIVYEKNGHEEVTIFNHEHSSYYGLFMKSSIYRENCYSCKYACSHRVGNLTVGDFWGIEKEHPEYLKQNGGRITLSDGVSCIMVNNEHGEQLINKFGNEIIIENSDFNKAAIANTQLREPSERNLQREVILENYRNKGYVFLDKQFNRQMFFFRIRRKLRKILLRR